MDEGDCGQASVEAAVMLPTMLIVLAMLLEPICVLYTRAVMESAASELCRVLATKNSKLPDKEVENYALRRLEGIPEGPPFHTGGKDDWSIETEGEEPEKSVKVTISGHVALFPIYGSVARLFSIADEKGLKLTVTVSETIRPDWLEGDYSKWVGMWES